VLDLLQDLGVVIWGETTDLVSGFEVISWIRIQYFQQDSHYERDVQFGLMVELGVAWHTFLRLAST
jgi:hypothetical protein